MKLAKITCFYKIPRFYFIKFPDCHIFWQGFLTELTQKWLAINCPAFTLKTVDHTQFLKKNPY